MDVTMLNLCGNATVPDANFIQARLADFTGSYGRTDSLYSNCPLVLAEQHEQSDVEQSRPAHADINKIVYWPLIALIARQASKCFMWNASFGSFLFFGCVCCAARGNERKPGWYKVGNTMLNTALQPPRSILNQDFIASRCDASRVICFDSNQNHDDADHALLPPVPRGLYADSHPVARDLFGELPPVSCVLYADSHPVVRDLFGELPHDQCGELPHGL
eukprot:1160546-Pelagomonas_calceolata.AAC.11